MLTPFAAIARFRHEVIAAIRALLVEDPLGAALPALVVGAGVVVDAIAADMERDLAALAVVAKAHALAGAQLDLESAGVASHSGEAGAEASAPQ